MFLIIKMTLGFDKLDLLVGNPSPEAICYIEWQSYFICYSFKG